MVHFDLRIARPPGSTIAIGGKTYTLGECLRGGTSLCYYASCETEREHYVVKEIYPLDARRNDAGDVCGDTNSSYKICLEAFNSEVDKLNQANYETYQCASPFIAVDKVKGIGVMHKHAKDTRQLDAAITEYIKETHTPIERLKWALLITRSLLIGLKKIHSECRLLHLDLSLSNLFVSDDGKDLVNTFFLDFGEARRMDNENSVAGESARSSGTTALFGAPERFLKTQNPEFSPATDLFSVAVLLFHLFTSQSYGYMFMPIPDAATLIKKNCTEVDYGLHFVDLSEGVKIAVSKFLKKGLAQDQKKRFQTAVEMLEQLEHLMNIVDSKGVYRELVFDKSLMEYRKTVSYEIKPELEPHIPASSDQHVLFCGDGGAGKTTFLYKCWKQFLDESKDDFSRPIPIYISVSEFNGNNPTFLVDQILKFYVTSYDGDIDSARKRIADLFTTERYILFVDGLNECTNPSALNQQINELTQFPLLRIFAASRTAFSGKVWEKFRQIQIDALSEKQVLDVLKAHRKIINTENQLLLTTLRRPMFLSIFLNLYPEMFKREISSPGEILEMYWEYLLDKFRSANHQDGDIAILKYALNIALPSLSAKLQTMSFVETSLDSCILNKTVYPTKRVLDSLENCGLIRKLSENPNTGYWTYIFTHQMIFDFAKAKKIRNEMDGWGLEDIEDNVKLLTSGPVAPSVLRLLADTMQEHTSEGKIESWMQTNIAGRCGPETQMVVRNLIEALKTVRGVNMAGCYQGLDLTLTDFYDTSVVGANFKNAVINETTFFSAGHRDHVSHLVSYTDANRKWLISASSDEGKIIIWDRNQQRHIQSIDCAGEIICIAVSESKKKCIAWFCDLYESSEITVWNIETDERLTIACTAQWVNQIGACSLCFHPTCDKLIFTNACFGQIEWSFSGDAIGEQIYPIQNCTDMILSSSPHQGGIGSFLPELVGRSGNVISLRNVNGNEKHKLKFDADLQAYSISPDGRYFGCIVAPYSFETIEMYSGELLLFDLWEFHPSPQNLGNVNNRATVVLTNNCVIVGCRKTTTREVMGDIWDIKTGRRLSVPVHVPLDAAAVINSEEIAVGVGTEVQVINVRTGKCKYELRGHRVAEYSTVIRFIHNENAFCRFFLDGTVAKFSLDDKSCHKILEGTTFKNSLATKTIPDAKCSHIFVTVGKEELHIYDAKTGILDYNINGDFSTCDTFTLLHNNRLLLAESSAHHSIILYDLDEQTTTQISGVNQWMEPIALHASLDTNHDTLFVSGKAVHIKQKQLHIYDYPDRLRSKRIQLIWRSLSNQDQLLNQQLFTSVGLPQSVDYVRDVRIILENTSSMVSAHYDGTLRLWTIGRDTITYQMSLSLCRDPIEHLTVISEDTVLAVSRKEQVFVCSVKNDKLQLAKTWSLPLKCLMDAGANPFGFPKYREIVQVLPVSKDFSYVTYPTISKGILLNHFTGEVVSNGISQTYDKDQCRWLVRSYQQNTFVVFEQYFMEEAYFESVVFSVYNAEDGSLRMEGTLDQLPNFGCAAISDCGMWFVVASTNGDMQIFNTYTGESFLWPKADVDLCGCDFRESFVTERLKEMLKMNGGIVD